MNERQSDFERLRAFSRAGDQNAFRELVRGHLNLVFATALRKTGDAGAAEEIAQNVFSALARRAWTFSPDDPLPAWLYKAALLESKMWIRGDFRRRRRENTAAELGTTMNSPNDPPAFHALVPLLDEALLSLRDQDRLALLLRYYEKQSLRDVGAALGVSEDTAQKRVAAALERVSEFFQRRGFRTASAAAAAALQHTAATASAGILASVTAAALECAPPTLTGVSAWLARLMALSRLQTAVVCTVVTACPVVWQFSEQHRSNDQLALVTAQLADTDRQLQTLQAQTGRLRAGVSALEASLSAADAQGAIGNEAARQFEAWRNRIRGELMADVYRWPDDSPFVRVPKSVLADLDTHTSAGISTTLKPPQPGATNLEWISYRGGWSSHTVFSAPGTLSSVGRELLGLTPDERTNIETALQNWISSTDTSMADSAYETNKATHIDIPSDAVASLVWVIPAAAQAGARKKQFEASSASILGDDRWPLMAAMLGGNATGSFQMTVTPFSLGMDQKSTEVVLWITPDQKRIQSRSWSGTWQNQDGMNGAYVADLAQFVPGSAVNQSGGAAMFLGVDSLPGTVQQRMVQWAQQQAAQRLGKETAK